MMTCVPCMLAGQETEATEMIGVTSACVDCMANAMRLCARCGYWVASVGSLCEQCATEAPR